MVFIAPTMVLFLLVFAVPVVVLVGPLSAIGAPGPHYLQWDRKLHRAYLS